MSSNSFFLTRILRMKGKIFCIVLVALFAFVYSFEHHKENERLVTTPFGLIPKGCVFHAREDEIVYFY